MPVASRHWQWPASLGVTFKYWRAFFWLKKSFSEKVLGSNLVRLIFSFPEDLILFKTEQN